MTYLWSWPNIEFRLGHVRSPSSLNSVALRTIAQTTPSIRIYQVQHRADSMPAGLRYWYT